LPHVASGGQPLLPGYDLLGLQRGQGSVAELRQDEHLDEVLVGAHGVQLQVEARVPPPGQNPPPNYAGGAISTERTITLPTSGRLLAAHSVGPARRAVAEAVRSSLLFGGEPRMRGRRCADPSSRSAGERGHCPSRAAGSGIALRGADEVA